MNTTTTPVATTPKPRCAFCFDREQGKHGEIKREWSPEWLQFIPVCRKHATFRGMIDGMIDKAESHFGEKAESFTTGNDYQPPV